MITKSTPLKQILELGKPCKCKACTIGCQYGSGTLKPEDHKPLAQLLGVSEDELKTRYLEPIEKFNTKRFRPKLLRKNNKPFGACIFYDEKVGCKVHQAKPTECKVAMGCITQGPQISLWFMINEFVNPHDAQSVREYASYLKYAPIKLKGAELETLIPDKQQREEILNQKTR